MLTIVDFIVLSIFVWRISYMFIHEEGFLKIIERFRYLIGKKLYKRNENHELVPIDSLEAKQFFAGQKLPHSLTWVNETHLADLFSCIYCLSVWVGTLTSIAFGLYAGLDLIQIIFLAFALSGMSIFLNKRVM